MFISSKEKSNYSITTTVTFKWWKIKLNSESLLKCVILRYFWCSHQFELHIDSWLNLLHCFWTKIIVIQLLLEMAQWIIHNQWSKMTMLAYNKWSKVVKFHSLHQQSLLSLWYWPLNISYATPNAFKHRLFHSFCFYWVAKKMWNTF